MASACLLACATLAVASLWTAAARVRSADRNGDGRADVWRTYNRQGQLAEVDVDTNFDGRADVHEYFERGSLVRRETDRDFNDRVDLVQDFDPATREQVRSVVDVDFDGTADLLVLFRGGEPAFSTWTRPVVALAGSGHSTPGSPAPHRTANDQLAPLQDPFRADLSLRTVHVPASAADWVGLSTSGGLAAASDDAASPLASSSALSGSRACRPAAAPVDPHSPRGPPASHLLS